MASRKQKIKQKRQQEEKLRQRVQIGAGIAGVLVVLALVIYVVIESGILEPPPVDLAEFEPSGTPQQICNAATPAITGGTNGQYPQAPPLQLEANTDYQAIFCTSEGPVYVDLLEGVAPITVNSFIFLANNNYYNNTVFHRVLDGFMAQGGDPTGTGAGGPGYQFVNETSPEYTFDSAGVLAMANAGPNTNGSQFFITFAPAPFLDGQYSIFGQVISGQENVDALQRIDPQSPNPAITPSDLEAVVIVTPDQVTQ